MTKRHQYGNILEKPLTNPDELLLLYQTDMDATIAFKKELKERTDALFGLYNLTPPKQALPEPMIKLIVRMARSMKIPGFFLQSDIKTPGRPAKWRSAEGLLLFLRTYLHSLDNPNLSIRSVLRRIKDKYNYKQSLNALNTRYYEATKSVVTQQYLNILNKATVNQQLSEIKKKIKILESILLLEEALGLTYTKN